MLTLTLIRHAKSSWKEENLTDFERPLNKRGKREAPIVGAYMKKQNICPELIFCSTAVRTRETVELLLSELGEKCCDVEYLDELYLIGQNRLMKMARSFPDDKKHIAIIAHNPGLHEFALSLVSEAPRERLLKLSENLPTTGLVNFEFDFDSWSEIDLYRGVMKDFVTPSLLSSGSSAA